MVQILIIIRDGSINSTKIIDMKDLYKKCGFRKSEGFENIIGWKESLGGSNIDIELWGRTSGKGNLKNNYKFPILLDKIVYGNCLLIAKDSTAKLRDLTIPLWNEFSNKINKKDINEKFDGPIEVKDILENFHNIDLDINDNKYKNSDGSIISNQSVISDSDISSVSDNSSEIGTYEEISDSELKEDSYIYSSEEEFS
jgi:hypothetical protein